jgi:antitoxin component YwqK of YwqJK toxin-antitoxin module
MNQNKNLPKSVPSWFEGDVYEEGGKAQNRLSGESIELNALELSIYDLIEGSKMFIEIKYSTDMSDERTIPFQKSIREGKLWFSDNNPKAYKILFEQVENNSLISINDDETTDVGIVTHYKGQPFSGILFNLYWDGSIRVEYEMINGLKHGKHKKFYLNGQIESESLYVRDKKHGLSIENHENGNISEKSLFKNGLYHGEVSYYYENGKIELMENYLEDKLNGESKTWNINGWLEGVETYANDKKHGDCIEYYENGKIKTSKTYQHGSLLNVITYDEKGAETISETKPEPLTNQTDADMTANLSPVNDWKDFLLSLTGLSEMDNKNLLNIKFDIFFCKTSFVDDDGEEVFFADEMQIKTLHKDEEDGKWYEGDQIYFPDLICGDDTDNNYETYIVVNTPAANPELADGWSNSGEMTLDETIDFLEKLKVLDYELLADDDKHNFKYFSLSKINQTKN